METRSCGGCRNVDYIDESTSLCSACASAADRSNEADMLEQERDLYDAELEEAQRQNAIEQNERAIAEAQPESQGAVGAVREKVEQATALKERAERVIAAGRATVERTRWAIQSFITTVTNPAFWIAVLVVIVLFLVANAAVTTYQTVGSMRESGAGAGMSSEVLERLAQRAVLLSQIGYKYPEVDSFVAAHGGDPRTNGNRWSVACPDIVNIIYGMPERYIGNNGNVNAYENYKRLIASGLEAQAWYFPETSSPGATLSNPPAGAIVQARSGNPAGHTYVVLTDDGKIIDNTWNINSSGPASGLGYRIMDSATRAGILGWFVPPAEGYEGTFLNEDPMLPPVPDWAIGQGTAATGPAVVVTLSAQHMAIGLIEAVGRYEKAIAELFGNSLNRSPYALVEEKSSSLNPHKLDTIQGDKRQVSYE